MKTLSDSCVITGPVRLSYLQVFQPRVNKQRNNESEYSAVLLFPKKEHEYLPDPKSELKGVADAIKATLEAKFPGCKKWDSPLKDGDAETNNEGEPKHPGYWFLPVRAKVEYPPVLINGERIPVTAGWNSGDWGKAKINFYAYDFEGKKGVGSGLRAIQFLYKDEPFGQSNDPASVANEFEAVENAHSGATSQSGEDAYDPFTDE